MSYLDQTTVYLFYLANIIFLIVFLVPFSLGIVAKFFNKIFKIGQNEFKK